MPDAGKYLLASAALRLQANILGIKRIEAHEKGGFIEFSQRNKVDPSFLIGLLQSAPQTYRLDGPSKLKFILDLSDRMARIEFLKNLLTEFSEHQLNG